MHKWKYLTIRNTKLFPRRDGPVNIYYISISVISRLRLPITQKFTQEISQLGTSLESSTVTGPDPGTKDTQKLRSSFNLMIRRNAYSHAALPPHQSRRTPHQPGRHVRTYLLKIGSRNTGRRRESNGLEKFGQRRGLECAQLFVEMTIVTYPISLT